VKFITFFEQNRNPVGSNDGFTYIFFGIHASQYTF
jgi:hypothetical protein